MRKKTKNENDQHTTLHVEKELAQNVRDGVHHRCKKCNKLLGINNFITPSFDIKCPRCGVINAILQNFDGQLFITDKTGTILFINKQVEKVTGYSSKEIIGKRPSLWGKQMSKKFYKDMWGKILHEKKAIAVEITNRTKKGKLYQTNVRISPLLNEAGEVEYFLAIETISDKSQK